VRAKNVIAVGLLLAALGANAHAQSPSATDPSTYETVLIPFEAVPASDPLLGANGSRWAVELQVYNLHDDEVLFNQGGPICPLPGGCETQSGFPALPAGFIGTLERSPGRTGITGRLQHVERVHSSRVRFQLRLFEVSRANENLGTEVPVVREPDFLTGRSALLIIPVSGEARVALRIYDPSGGIAGEAFSVRVYPEFGADLLWETSVGLTVFIPQFFPGFPPLPGYAELFSLEQRPELAGYERVRIEIEPLDPSVKYWAMASITNNSTQMVTIVSPQ
jgi:hypothetical protein